MIKSLTSSKIQKSLTFGQENGAQHSFYELQGVSGGKTPSGLPWRSPPGKQGSSEGAALSGV